MELIVSAYNQLVRLDFSGFREGEPLDPTTNEPFDRDWYVKPPIHPNFRSYAGDLDGNVHYHYEYRITYLLGSAARFRDWKNQLQQFAGQNVGLFFELVAFVDSKGSIGTSISTKLAADFAREHKRMKSISRLRQTSISVGFRR